MTPQTLAHAPRPHFESLLRLGKPKVVSMIVFTAIIGMLLATPGAPSPSLVASTALGIWLVASSAAALNCLLEQRLDRLMARTRARPLVRDEVGRAEAIAFIAVTGAAGLAILFRQPSWAMR